MNFVRGGLLVAAVIAIAACTARPAAQPEVVVSVPPDPAATAVAAGCGPADLALPEEKPEDLSGRRGWSRQTPIATEAISQAAPEELAPGLAAVGIARHPGDLPVASYLLLKNASTDLQGKPQPILMAYFSKAPLGPGDSNISVIEGGGAFVAQTPTRGQGAAIVIETIGERATMVDVGAYKGALVHADLLSSDGLRPWNLYWSDGTRDFWIEAGTSAEDVVTVGRAMMCS